MKLDQDSPSDTEVRNINILRNKKNAGNTRYKSFKIIDNFSRMGESKTNTERHSGPFVAQTTRRSHFHPSKVPGSAMMYGQKSY